MPQRITVVDAFTAEPFAGNPAGVCIMAGPADARPGSDLGTSQVETFERALIRRSIGHFGENCGQISTETVCQPREA